MKPTPAFGRAASAAAIFGALALLTRRIELLAFAAPFATAAVLATVLRRGGAPRITFEVDRTEVTEGEVIRVSVEIVSDVDLDALSVDLITTGLEPGPGQPKRWVVVVQRDVPVRLSVELAAAYFGRYRVGPVRVTARGPLLLSGSSTTLQRQVDITVLPSAERFRATDTAPQPLAFAGDHRSRASGPGIDFSAIRPFSIGDPIRRVNWRATLKMGELHVTSVFAERTTEATIVIDSARDAGERGRSALDLAVRAAASISEHYLGRGDVVRLVEIGGGSRTFSPRGGRRSIELVRRWLIDVAVRTAPSVGDASFAALAARGRRGVVIVLSPLLDDRSVSGLATLRKRGSAIVAVDTLRDSMLPEPRDGAERIAHTLWTLEREMLVARLADLGVPVVSWAGSGSLDSILTDLARMAAAPRIALR